MNLFVLATLTCMLATAPALSASASAPVVWNEDALVLDTLWNAALETPADSSARVGLALGGGGSRGLAHIGILKVFEEEKIPVNMVAGASVGALIGALYAAGVSTTELETMARDVGWDSLTNWSNLAVLRLMMVNRLLSTRNMEAYFKRHIGDMRFEELQRPFACVATDLQTGERVIFREGAVAPAARASATIPGLFEPVNFRHRYLVDGGLVGNIPTDLVRALGADVVVAIDVSADYSNFEPKNVLATMSQALFIQGARLSEPFLKAADWVIRPEMSDISPIDLSRSQDCIDAGVLAARRAAPRLKQLLIDRRWTAVAKAGGAQSR